MAVTIGSNLLALGAQRSLQRNSTELSRHYERLSSGLRILRASDDPAGIAVASTLHASSRIFGQGILNVNDGLSALNIAQGSLEQLSAIGIRQKELAEQAANGALSYAQRLSLNKEAAQLTKEFNRIVSTATFNGRALLTRTEGDLRIQAGFGVNGSVDTAIAQQLSKSVGTGQFGSGTAYAPSTAATNSTLADVNGDGILDIVGAQAGTGVYLLAVRRGNGDGTFASATTQSASGAQSFDQLQSILVEDINGDGKVDLVVGGSQSSGPSDRGKIMVFNGNGNGTFNTTPAQSFLTGTASDATYQRSDQMVLMDFNGDGVKDIAQGDNYDNQVRVFLGRANGTFDTSVAATFSGYYFSAAEINNDGKTDLVVQDSTTSTVYISQTAGTFSSAGTLTTGGGALAAGDFDGDGNIDIASADAATTIRIFNGLGSGAFSTGSVLTAGATITTLAAGDINGDGSPDLVARLSGPLFQSFIANENRTFTTGTALTGSTTAGNLFLGDTNGDGVADIFADGSAQVFLATNMSTSTNAAYLDLTSITGARSALGALDALLQRISLELGSIGSGQSRLNSTLNTLRASSENFTAAAGRIEDADVAYESAGLVRTQILQSAGMAVLSQANQAPALALQLLG